MGHLYKPKKSRYWWIKYYANGRAHYESTRTENERLTERLLKDREGRVIQGQPILPRADRVTYDEAAADLKRHYETTGAATSRKRRGASTTSGRSSRATAS